jgi:hypothetical protein
VTFGLQGQVVIQALSVLYTARPSVRGMTYSRQECTGCSASHPVKRLCPLHLMGRRSGEEEHTAQARTFQPDHDGLIGRDCVRQDNGAAAHGAV